MRLLRAAGIALAALALYPATALANGQSELLAAVNSVRAQHGLAPVRVNADLHRAAIRHSDDEFVRHYFAHTSPSGVDVYHRIVNCGYPIGVWRAGETLAYGYPTATEVVAAWLRSPEHRAILLGNWRDIGIGRARGGGRVYWTAEWGTRGGT